MLHRRNPKVAYYPRIFFSSVLVIALIISKLSQESVCVVAFSTTGTGSTSFAVHRGIGKLKHFRLASTATTSSVPDIQRARDRVLEVAEKSFRESVSGVFITDPSAKSALKKAVANLEAVSPTTPSNPQQIKGRWKLVCTTNSGSLGVTFKSLSQCESETSDKGSKKGMFPLLPPLSTFNIIQEKLRKSVQVIQRIRKINSDSGEEIIDRVDNIIEFTPMTLFDQFFDSTETSNRFSTLLNPLNVTRAQLTLAHKANVEGTTPVLRTKIVLQSIIRK